MPALILDYFGDWRTRRLTCPACGWTGTFEEGDRELFNDLQDCACPGTRGPCPRPMLAVLPFPTLDEWRAHREELDEPQRRFIERLEAAARKSGGR